MKIDTIWLEYRSKIKAFLHSKISNPADVDDLLQVILIKTYNKIGTLKSESNFKSWVFQMANHVIIDFYRKNKKAQYINIESFPDLNKVEEDDDAQKMLAKCIEPFIKALPKQDEQLLMAIDIEGQSQKEYAEKNGLKYSTLKSRVKKSREKLRALFERCCNFSLDRQGRLVDFRSKSKSCKKC